MNKVISLQNHKGGVGKTTLTFLLGTFLAQKGKKVLVIDTDPQANLTRSFQVDPENISQSILHAWTGKLGIGEVLISLGEGITLIPSNFELAFLEQNFPPYVMSKETQLRKAVAPILPEYDVTIVDTPPNFGLNVASVLAIATDIIVPVNPHPFALNGFEQFFRIFEAAQQELNPRLTSPRILLNMAERTNITRTIQDLIDDRFPGKALRTTLRRSVRIAEITVTGQSIPSDLGDDLEQLVNELELL
jgi:chromosome partitioning protein